MSIEVSAQVTLLSLQLSLNPLQQALHDLTHAQRTALHTQTRPFQLLPNCQMHRQINFTCIYEFCQGSASLLHLRVHTYIHLLECLLTEKHDDVHANDIFRCYQRH